MTGLGDVYRFKWFIRATCKHPRLSVNFVNGFSTEHNFVLVFNDYLWFWSRWTSFHGIRTCKRSLWSLAVKHQDKNQKQPNLCIRSVSMYFYSFLEYILFNIPEPILHLHWFWCWRSVLFKPISSDFCQQLFSPHNLTLHMMAAWRLQWHSKLYAKHCIAPCRKYTHFWLTWRKIVL